MKELDLVIQAIITDKDLELLESILGMEIPKDSFALGEACGTQLPIDMYCKFTSAELGAAHAFIS